MMLKRKTSRAQDFNKNVKIYRANLSDHQYPTNCIGSFKYTLAI
uniref:Uncharacterized protein n=1 Tax=Vibrio alginolyticus TaxID=663 RepID=A0A0P0HG43_VIBAL|nr:hypothetical protein ICEValA056_074 [Vibrio alginolyticus]